LKTEDYTVQVNENSDMRLPIIFRYLKSNKNKIVQYELYDKYGNKIENNSFNVNE
jgi:spore coat protein U-like protein